MNSQGLLKGQRLTTREIKEVERAITNGEEVHKNGVRQKVLEGMLTLVDGLYELAIEREQRPSCLFVV